jgi:hypothetical protein
MSDNVLKLIPTSPAFVPASESVERATAILRDRFLHADEVQARLSDQVRFIDQGANLESVRCPYDDKQLTTEWWQETMDAANQSGFRDLSVILPCCGRNSSLNELNYKWPAGFARFSLEVHNPQGDVSAEEFTRLEQILETGLTKIWAHY